jgi:hypothetical protein
VTLRGGDLAKGNGPWKLAGVEMNTNWNSLLGKFFVAYDEDGGYDDIGEVIGELGSGAYVVQFYSRYGGEATCIRVVSTAEMSFFTWFPDMESIGGWIS